MKNWKQWSPLAITVLFAAWILSAFRLPAEKDVQSHAFGRIPMVEKGRHQPLDSFARNALMQIREKQTANYEPWKGSFDKPKIVGATDWALEVAFKPELGDTRPIFRIDNPDVKTLLGLSFEASAEKKTDGKHYSWNDLQGRYGEFKAEARRAFGVLTDNRNAYERALTELWNATGIYKQVRNLFGPAATGDLTQGLRDYLAKVQAGRAAFNAQMENQPFDAAALDWINDQLTAPLIVPAHRPELGDKDEWLRAIQETMIAEQGGKPHFSLTSFAEMAAGYRAGDAAALRKASESYLGLLAGNDTFKKTVAKSVREQRFNNIEPFYKGMILCVVAFLFALMFWISPRRFGWARRAAVWLMVLTFIVHLGGQIFRMVQEGRPPVTNLYSSAIFIGLMAVLFGLLLERVFPHGIGVIVAATVDFCALLIAHHLARGGDTMIMLQAVLDTNFWLATHVVTVTLGYAATYVAGFLAILYVVLGTFTSRLAEPLESEGGKTDRPLGQVLTTMTYAIICFAVLFSFIGTVLGGIWADQSWGRFWGWDVKENGALMIVLWNAIVLHARWGGIAKERGIACLAIAGNIVTSWSWFGVNMLGIGLHSYGFMGAAFVALVLFCASQLVLIVMGRLACRAESVPRSQKSAPPAGASPVAA